MSDAGAVSARSGFKYQDHVAANFVLKMLGDRRIVQVECETSDDITMISIRDGVLCPEYIQVKTTDKDSKWTSTELSTRDPKGKLPTSLIEKSLLCDKHGSNARFRLVGRRAVNKTLAALLDPIETRRADGGIANIASAFKKKFPTTTSENGHDIEYWTTNAYWEVFSGMDSLEHKNLQVISRLAEEEGANPTHSQSKEIYRSLLEKVEAAALASRRNQAEKIIERREAIVWWKSHLETCFASQRASAKPYRAKGERFFVQIHNIDHATLMRRSSGYDTQFERKTWRSEQLARYLSDWIPEVTLRASELVEIDQLNLRRKVEEGLRTIKANGTVDIDRLLSETLLHAVLRHWFESEPIACKLYHRSALGDRITKNAHLVHAAEGDQLWLGRTHLFKGTDKNELLATIRDELTDAMQTDVLVEERDIILQLREPQHLISNSLSLALERGAPIDELIKVLCLPVLVAYDSEVLAKGHADDYADHLAGEALAMAETCIGAIPAELNEVQVHVFLIPVQRISALTASFEQMVGLA